MQRQERLLLLNSSIGKMKKPLIRIQYRFFQEFYNILYLSKII